MKISANGGEEFSLVSWPFKYFLNARELFPAHTLHYYSIVINEIMISINDKIQH